MSENANAVSRCDREEHLSTARVNLDRLYIWVRLQIMEDSFESVNKSMDLDNPSEQSVDLDDPAGKECSKGLSDDLPSDSSLGRLMDSSQDESDFQLAIPKVEFSGEDMVDNIHVDKSQNSLLNVREVNGEEVFEKQEVEEQDSVSNQQSSGEEYGDEVASKQISERVTSFGGREGRRCSARLQGKTRKRWTSKDQSLNIEREI